MIRITRYFIPLDKTLDISNIDQFFSDLDRTFEKCLEQDKKKREKRRKNRERGKKEVRGEIECNCGSVTKFSFSPTVTEEEIEIECKNPDCNELVIFINESIEDMDEDYDDEDDGINF